MEIIALIATYVVFGGIGVVLASRFKKPLTVNMWITLAVVTIFSQWIMPNARVVDIFGFKMYVNYSLQGFFGGMLAGLSIRRMRAS